MLLSGLLADDEQEILEKATKNNLILNKKTEDKNWICLKLHINQLVFALN